MLVCVVLVVQFNRLYWLKFDDERKENKDRFKRYWMVLCLGDLNDIRFAVNVNLRELKGIISKDIKESDDDLEKIYNLYQELKDKNIEFCQWMDLNQIDDFIKKELFEKNGIFCIDSLLFIIPSKKDLVHLVEESRLQFDVNSDSKVKHGGKTKGIKNIQNNQDLIEKLWTLISTLH